MIDFRDRDKVGIVDIVVRLAELNFRKKRNIFFLIVGETGSGKSYTALTLADAIEKRYKNYLNVSKQIVYFPEQFKDVFEYVKEFKKKTIIFDEAHVSISSRRWFDYTNMAINTILSTFRQLHQCAVFFVAPLKSFIDKQVRGLVDYYIIVRKKLIDEQIVVYAQIYSVEKNYYDFTSDTTYIKKVVFKWKNRVWTAGNLKVPLPPEEIKNEYEKISSEFKAKIFLEKADKLANKLKRV